MSKIRNILIGAASGVALATSLIGAALATDFQVLRDDTRVHSELVSASQAYLIDESCPNLTIRRLALVSKALSLRSYAKRLGYSGSEVDAYVNDQTEQARFRVIASALLVEKGAVTGNTASFCDIGRAEMAAKTYTGAILRGG